MAPRPSQLPEVDPFWQASWGAPPTPSQPFPLSVAKGLMLSRTQGAQAES